MNVFDRADFDERVRERKRKWMEVVRNAVLLEEWRWRRREWRTNGLIIRI